MSIAVCHYCQLDAYLHFVSKLLLDAMQRMVEEEELQFHEDYINEQDPSILHFLLASGDDVCRILTWKFLLPT